METWAKYIHQGYLVKTSQMAGQISFEALRDVFVDLVLAQLSITPEFGAKQAYVMPRLFSNGAAAPHISLNEFREY